MPMWPVNRSTRTLAPLSAVIRSSRSWASSKARWASIAISAPNSSAIVEQRALEVGRELAGVAARRAAGDPVALDQNTLHPSSRGA